MIFEGGYFLAQNTIRKKISLIVSVILVLFGISIIFNIFSLINSNNGLENYKFLSDETGIISEIEMNFFLKLL